MKPRVGSFFDKTTSSWTHVVHDPETRCAAVVDPVLSFDPAGGNLCTDAVRPVLDYIDEHALGVDWILETHVHADHLSAACAVQQHCAGAQVGIGIGVGCVQRALAQRLNIGPDFVSDGRQFDVLFEHGETFSVGNLTVRVMHTPGHTPACVTYVIDEIAFVGDTLFMPDLGSARTDFPGGNACDLFRSIRAILSLAPETTLYLCHDYPGEDRPDARACRSVAEQRNSNVHINDGVDEGCFVALRTRRDSGLSVPRLMYPAVQFNIRGGRLPPPEANGAQYLKLPVVETP